MAFSIPTSSEIITRSIELLKRFPLAIISSLIVTFISIYLIQVDFDKSEAIYLTLIKIALSSSLAIFIFTAVRLIGESISVRWHIVITFLALIGVLSYYMILPDKFKDFDVFIVPFRHFFLGLLFLVAFLWAPFVGSKLSNEDYWEYSKQVMFALVISFLFTIVMILGINGALFAVEKLFDLDIKGKRYFQIDIFIVGAFSVGYFLSQISLRPLESKQSPNPPRVEKFFTKWILTPLSGLYFVILYAYSFKVLSSMDWPKGILAWLIVIFSMVAILTYLFWTHFAKEQSGKWRRWIWLAVLLQTVMLFIAIGIRISEYSWTESRYMVFVLGVWLFGISIYFLLFKQARIKWIFISLSLLIAITQFGPFNAYIVSKNAQMQRLQNMITEIKTYKDTAKAPLKLRYEISDALWYLDRRYRGDSLSSILPRMTKEFDKIKARREANRKTIEKQREEDKVLTSEMKKEKEELYKYASALPYYITNELGFEFINRWKYQRMKEGKQQDIRFSSKDKRGYIGSKNKMIDVREYDYIAHINMGGYRYVKRSKEAVQLEQRDFSEQNMTLIYTKNHQLSILKNDINITIKMEDFFKKLVDKYGKKTKDVEAQDLIIKKQNDNIKVKLEIGNISEEFFDDNKTIEFMGILFVKELR